MSNATYSKSTGVICPCVLKITANSLRDTLSTALRALSMAAPFLTFILLKISDPDLPSNN